MESVGEASFSSAGGRPLGAAGPYLWDVRITLGLVNYSDGLLLRELIATSSPVAHMAIGSVIDVGEDRNIIAKIEGEREEVVLVTAHCDTILAPGFRDNAAGVAGVLEIAGVLSEAVDAGLYTPEVSIAFVTFAAEELGLVGSTNYLRMHLEEMERVLCVINMDCIGGERPASPEPTIQELVLTTD